MKKITITSTLFTAATVFAIICFILALLSPDFEQSRGLRVEAMLATIIALLLRK
jgi:hypothetical protein